MAGDGRLTILHTDFHRGWGGQINRVLAEWNVDWKKAYVAYKSELAGEEQVAARYQYLDALADAWGRTMYGGMAAWCRSTALRPPPPPSRATSCSR